MTFLTLDLSIPIPNAFVATMTSIRSNIKSSCTLLLASGLNPAWYQSAAISFFCNFSQTFSTSFRVLQNTMVGSFSLINSSSQLILSLGSSIPKYKFARSKLVTTSKGCCNFNCCLISIRTLGVAVAVKAATMGRVGSCATNVSIF